jgi:hypothetical protein
MAVMIAAKKPRSIFSACWIGQRQWPTSLNGLPPQAAQYAAQALRNSKL